VMSPSDVHQLRNLLAVILGAIDTGNLALARQAVLRAESCIVACELKCESCELLNAPPSKWTRWDVNSPKRP
jgi:hypothetical protein